MPILGTLVSQRTGYFGRPGLWIFTTTSKGNTMTYPYTLLDIVWNPDDATHCVLSGEIVQLVPAGDYSAVQ